MFQYFNQTAGQFCGFWPAEMTNCTNRGEMWHEGVDQSNKGDSSVTNFTQSVEEWGERPQTKFFFLQNFAIFFITKPRGMHPAYLVPVPSQDKLGGLEVGASMVWIGWRSVRLLAHLPLLSSPRLIKSRMLTDSHNTFLEWVGECLFWHPPTRVVPDKGP